MAAKQLPAEDRILAFYRAFVARYEAEVLALRYLYDENGQWPKKVNKLDPDPAGEKHTWQPNTVLFWEWRTRLDDFARELRDNNDPLDPYRAFIAQERRKGMGRDKAFEWIHAQDFPGYFKDWACSY